MWPLASAAASLVFLIPVNYPGTSTGLYMLAGLLYGLIQGGVMRYLRLQPEEREKAKVDTAQTDETLADRAVRLQEAQTEDRSEIYREDQSRQHNAQ